MATRDERLAKLKEAVKEWADSKRRTTKASITSAERLLNQRGELANTASSPVEALVVDEIQQFLDGSI